MNPAGLNSSGSSADHLSSVGEDAERRGGGRRRSHRLTRVSIVPDVEDRLGFAELIHSQAVRCGGKAFDWSVGKRSEKSFGRVYTPVTEMDRVTPVQSDVPLVRKLRNSRKGNRSVRKVENPCHVDLWISLRAFPNPMDWIEGPLFSGHFPPTPCDFLQNRSLRTTGVTGKSPASTSISDLIQWNNLSDTMTRQEDGKTELKTICTAGKDEDGSSSSKIRLMGRQDHSPSTAHPTKLRLPSLQNRLMFLH